MSCPKQALLARSSSSAEYSGAIVSTTGAWSLQDSGMRTIATSQGCAEGATQDSVIQLGAEWVGDVTADICRACAAMTPLMRLGS